MITCRRLFVAGAVGLLLASSGCASRGSVRAGQPLPADQRQGLRTPGSPATLADLGDIDQLKTLFNQHPDVPRLVLLLSPT